MLEALFGADMPLAVRFFLAFLIVLGLIGATAWAVRRFGAGRLGGAGTRGRQPRLAVVDYASVDSRRRLILEQPERADKGERGVMVEKGPTPGGPGGLTYPLTRPQLAVLGADRAPGCGDCRVCAQSAQCVALRCGRRSSGRPRGATHSRAPHLVAVHVPLFDGRIRRR
jgi:hypothetical protein